MRLFEKWKKNVAKAAELNQKLQVVFFAGQVGKGKVDWEDLPTADLWDGKGCGGSQKSEIAYLEKQGFGYVEIDAIHFLRKEFDHGKDVIALDGQEWKRGRIVTPPQPLVWNSHSEATVEQTARCSIQCSKTGRVFATDQVRHGDTMQSFLKAIGEDTFLQTVRETLPEGAEVLGSRPQESILQDGEVSE